MSRRAACGPPFGMGLDVESSGAGAGLPPGLWYLLGFRVCDGPVEGKYSTCVPIASRGSCHIWGTWLDAEEADGEFSRRSGRFVNRLYGGGDGFRLGRSRLGGGVRLQEGWIPASAGKTDGGGVGGERDVLAELGRLSLDPSTRILQRRMFHLRQGERNSPPLGMDSGSRGSRLGGGVRLQEGWIPASAGKTDGGGWGVSAMYWQNWAACRSTLRRGSRLGGCSIRDRVSGPSPGDGFRVSGVPARRGGCAFRRDGFLPPQERRMEGDWGGGGENWGRGQERVSFSISSSMRATCM